MNNLKKELDDLDAAITQIIANGAALMADISRLRIINAELLAALEAVNRLDYIREHPAISSLVNAAIARARG